MVPGRHSPDRWSSSSAELMEPGDIIIDGGNSNYRDDIDRAAALRGQGHPLRRRRHERRRVRPRARLLPDDRRRGRRRGAPRPALRDDRARRSTRHRAHAGRAGEPSPEEQGYLHCGPNGAGHFVKMVHNGIEYGMMAAYAEGLNVLHHANARQRRSRRDSAEVDPARPPASTTSTTSTSPRSPRCGGAARSSRRGCST